MTEEVFITNSFEETQKLGEDFSRSHLKQGETLTSARVIALYGDLGSGKTTFVQGLAKGLGIKKRIISPTFIIARTYNINFKFQISNFKSTPKNAKLFNHIDLYRVNSEADLDGLGIKEILNDPENIVVIEWAEKLKGLLPKERIEIHFKYLGENKRRITIAKIA